VVEGHHSGLEYVVNTNVVVRGGMLLSFTLNRNFLSVDYPLTSPVLDLLRMDPDLKGTRRGCGEGDCGACTVLLGQRTGSMIQYRAVNSCLLPAGELVGRHLMTIEGLNQPHNLSSVQSHIVDQGASQCGFCTPGIVVSLTAYLMETLKPQAEEAVSSLAGNICRCTGYSSLVRAATNLCVSIPESPASDPCSIGHLRHLVSSGVLPEWVPAAAESLPDQSTLVPSAETSDALIVAGGTDLMATGAETLHGVSVRFLSRDPSLAAISMDDGICSIGAAATVSDLMGSQAAVAVDGLEKALYLISSKQIRNRATIGGNIVNASPIGDLSVIFLVFDAMLSVDGRFGTRMVPMKEFHTGYKEMDLRPGEMIRELSMSIPAGTAKFNFEKVSMRKHLDIASVNSAALISAENGEVLNASISAGGVAPIPLHLARTSDMLAGMSISPETAMTASRSAMDEIAPIDDVRGSAEYKRNLLGRLVLAHFLKLFPGSIDPEAVLP